MNDLFAELDKTPTVGEISRAAKIDGMAKVDMNAATKAVRMPTQSKWDSMLARLKAGPLSTYEAERFLHRGQAVIHSMVKSGYEIERRVIDGIDCYVYFGHSALVKVTKTLKEKYYDTPHWRRTALARKQMDEFRCRQCGSGDDLHTHHWRYNLFHESVLHDLITLCATCHDLVHEAIKGSEVHFPDYLTEEQIAKIEGKNGNHDAGPSVAGENGTSPCEDDAGRFEDS